VPEEPSDKFRIFTGSQQQCRRRMAGLIRSPFFQTEPAEQRIPNARPHIAVVKRLPKSITKNVLAPTGSLVLPFQRLVYRAEHRYFTLGAIGFGVFGASLNKGLSSTLDIGK